MWGGYRFRDSGLMFIESGKVPRVTATYTGRKLESMPASHRCATIPLQGNRTQDGHAGVDGGWSDSRLVAVTNSEGFAQCPIRHAERHHRIRDETFMKGGLHRPKNRSNGFCRPIVHAGQGPGPKGFLIW